MSGSRDQFLDLVVDGFGDDLEKKHVARRLLAEQIKDEDVHFEKAVEQLKRVHQRPKWVVGVICWSMILAGLLMVFAQAKHVYGMRSVLTGQSVFGVPVFSQEYDAWSFYFKDLSEQDKLLLFGDTSQLNEAERREGFWKSEPDNVGAYVEYLSTYRSDHGDFPDDMLQMGEELDAENALFPLFAASQLARDCTHKVSPPRAPRHTAHRASHKKRGSSHAGASSAVGRAYVKITDVEKHRDAMALLRRAAEMPTCLSYSGEMMQRRLPLLQRDDHDWMTRIFPVVILTSQTSHSMPWLHLSKLIEAEAYRCELEKDQQALKQLVGDWQRVAMHLHQMSQSLVDGLVLRAFIYSPCKDFALAAKACGLAEMEAYYTALDQRLADEKDGRNQAAKAVEGQDDFFKTSGVLSNLALPVLNKQVNDNSVMPFPDTRPERFADHAFWNRVTSAVHWILLVLCGLIVWVLSRSGNAVVRKTGWALAATLNWRDWSFVSVFGVLCPILLYWLVNGMETWLSVQNWNLNYGKMGLPSGQSGSLFLLLLVAPMLTIAYRIQRAIPFAQRRTPWLLWGAVTLAVLSMPVFGLAGHFDTNLKLLMYLGFTMHVGILAHLISLPLVRFIWRRKTQVISFQAAICRRVLAPIYVTASLVMVMQMPVYYVLEKHWVAEDKIFELSSEHTAFTMYETLVTKQLLKELDVLLQEVTNK